MKILTAIVLLFIFGVGIWFATIFIFKQKNELSENKITKSNHSLDQYVQESDSYPDKVSSIKGYSEIINERLFWVFSTPEIEYELSPDKKSYRLYYHEAPLGPFYGYDSKKKEWYVEE